MPLHYKKIATVEGFRLNINVPYDSQKKASYVINYHNNNSNQRFEIDQGEIDQKDIDIFMEKFTETYEATPNSIKTKITRCKHHQFLISYTVPTEPVQIRITEQTEANGRKILKAGRLPNFVEASVRMYNFVEKAKQLVAD